MIRVLITLVCGLSLFNIGVVGASIATSSEAHAQSSYVISQTGGNWLLNLSFIVHGLSGDFEVNQVSMTQLEVKDSETHSVFSAVKKLFSSTVTLFDDQGQAIAQLIEKRDQKSNQLYLSYQDSSQHELYRCVFEKNRSQKSLLCLDPSSNDVSRMIDRSRKMNHVYEIENLRSHEMNDKLLIARAVFDAIDSYRKQLLSLSAVTGVLAVSASVWSLRKETSTPPQAKTEDKHNIEMPSIHLSPSTPSDGNVGLQVSRQSLPSPSILLRPNQDDLTSSKDSNFSFSQPPLSPSLGSEEISSSASSKRKEEQEDKPSDSTSNQPLSPSEGRVSVSQDTSSKEKTTYPSKASITNSIRVPSSRGGLQSQTFSSIETSSLQASAESVEEKPSTPSPPSSPITKILSASEEEKRNFQESSSAPKEDFSAAITGEKEDQKLSDKSNRVCIETGGGFHPGDVLGIEKDGSYDVFFIGGGTSFSAKPSKISFEVELSLSGDAHLFYEGASRPGAVVSKRIVYPKAEFKNGKFEVFAPHMTGSPYERQIVSRDEIKVPVTLESLGLTKRVLYKRINLSEYDTALIEYAFEDGVILLDDPSWALSGGRWMNGSEVFREIDLLKKNELVSFKNRGHFPVTGTITHEYSNGIIEVESSNHQAYFLKRHQVDPLHIDALVPVDHTKKLEVTFFDRLNQILLGEVIHTFQSGTRQIAVKDWKGETHIYFKSPQEIGTEIESEISGYVTFKNGHGNQAVGSVKRQFSNQIFELTEESDRIATNKTFLSRREEFSVPFNGALEERNLTPYIAYKYRDPSFGIRNKVSKIETLFEDGTILVLDEDSRPRGAKILLKASDVFKEVLPHSKYTQTFKYWGKLNQETGKVSREFENGVFQTETIQGHHDLLTQVDFDQEVSPKDLLLTETIAFPVNSQYVLGSITRAWRNGNLEVSDLNGNKQSISSQSASAEISKDPRIGKTISFKLENENSLGQEEMEDRAGTVNYVFQNKLIYVSYYEEGKQFFAFIPEDKVNLGIEKFDENNDLNRSGPLGVRENFLQLPYFNRSYDQVGENERPEIEKKFDLLIKIGDCINRSVQGPRKHFSSRKSFSAKHLTLKEINQLTLAVYQMQNGTQTPAENEMSQRLIKSVGKREARNKIARAIYLSIHPDKAMDETNKKLAHLIWTFSEELLQCFKMQASEAN